jgi:RNA polymerase sigma factor (TIGR02999 family)
MPMVPPAPHDVTGLLAKWSAGDKRAEEELFRLVHGERRRIARRHMARARSGHTLQTTAVVNEAYLRLNARGGSPWRDRAHFFAASAKAMRHLLIDHARARGSAKRGGGQVRVTLGETSIPRSQRAPDVLALDEALERLAAAHPRRGQVVELRYFGGPTNDEIAEVLEISPATVERDWRYAQAWLYQELGGT